MGGLGGRCEQGMRRCAGTTLSPEPRLRYRYAPSPALTPARRQLAHGPSPVPLPCPQERQTESGIFLVDRTRHWLAVEWALWLNVNDHITYKLACEWGSTMRALQFMASEKREGPSRRLLIVLPIPPPCLPAPPATLVPPLPRCAQTATRTHSAPPSTWRAPLVPFTKCPTRWASCCRRQRCDRG